MKKIYLLFVLCLIGAVSRSQTAASYMFSRTTGIFTTISGDPGVNAITDPSGIASDDGTSAGIPIGFTFHFAGADYTTLDANANGWISLSGTDVIGSTYSPAATKIAGGGFLMAFWYDLYGVGQTAYYETTGTPGSQVFTMEWNTWATYDDPSAVIYFQIKLYEATGVVQYCYGTSSGSMPTNAVIGIANSNTDFQTLLSETATSTDLTFDQSCTFPADSTILQWCPPLTTPTISGNSDVCMGNINTLTANVPSGVWATSDGGIASVGTAGDVTGVSAGTATISYTVSNDCGSLTATLNVTVHSLPTVSGGSNVAVCAGNSAILTASGADVYSWLPADGLTCTDCSNPTATPTVTTTYTVTGTQFSYTTAMVYSQSFTSGVTSDATTPQGIAWGSYISSLPTQGVVGFTLRGSNDPTGLTCTDPTTAQSAADALRTGGSFSGTSDGHNWNVGMCVAGMEINADQLICDCNNPAYTVRPEIGNSNWGGINTNTCGGPSQTMEVVFYVQSGCNSSATVTVTVNPLPTVYNVIGGGNYCAGGIGVPVGLDSANTGINYQLYYGVATLGTPVAGANAPLTFGRQTASGTYTVVATDAVSGCTSTMSGNAPVGITPLVYPTVSIFASTSDTICAGTHTIFTTDFTGGGPTQHYIWKVNGSVVGTDSFAYDFAPATGNRVNVLMVSSAPCATPDTVSSDTVMMTVFPNGAPTVHLAATPGDSVCAGTSITINAAPTFGGYTPAYTWIKNTVIVSTLPFYTFTPIDGDNVYAIMNSNYMCATTTTAYSNVITASVTDPVVPSVTISARPGMTIYPGMPDTLIATAMNQGPNASYQWYLNGGIVAGATNSTWIRTSFSDHDSVTVMVTRNDACGLSTFNSVRLRVYPVGVQSLNGGADISLIPNPNRGTFTIAGTLGVITDEEISAEVTDLLGQSVYKTTFTAHSGKIDQPIQLSSALASGVYILNLHSSAGNELIRFVVER